MTDSAADEFQVGQYYSNREVRIYVVVRDNDGKEWNVLWPKEMTYSRPDDSNCQPGDYIRVKVGYEKETGKYVIICVNIIEKAAN